MGAKKNAAKAGAAAAAVKRSPYVQRIADDWFARHDVHVHVPAGAVPKDGPSAGVTMVTALMSLVTGRPVRDDTAMTGEITLTGQVLPIGGLKEKALAAQRAGITRVIAPRRNEPDLEDIPEHLRRNLAFVWANEIEEVLDAALEPPRDGRGNGAVAGFAQGRPRGMLAPETQPDR